MARPCLALLAALGAAGAPGAQGARPTPTARFPKARFSRARPLLASTTPKVVRFLFSDTGGGHRASALALKQALERLHPGRIECDLVDSFVATGQLPFKEFPAMYKWMADNPWAWQLVFEIGSTPPGLCLHETVTDLSLRPAFKEQLAARPRPDMVVSVHPLLQGPPMRALADLDGGRRKRPFATVVTDLGSAHPTWFHPKVDACFVPSDALRDLALRRGVPKDKVIQHGLPIREGFGAGAAPDKARARTALGLDPAKRTVLVVGGGDGMGALQNVAGAVVDALGADAARDGGPGSQVVVVCGRNDAARAALDARARPPGVSVFIKGFIDDMDAHMAASDVLVTKAGPGTIAEAAAMGLPCVLSSFLPGQEEGNVAFVREAGFGEYRGDAPGIARLVAAWARDGPGLERMAAAARAAARPHATEAIAKDLARMVLGEA